MTQTNEIVMRVDEDDDIVLNIAENDEVSFSVNEAIVIKDHAILDNRDLPDQHPISAITGLQEALDSSGAIDTVKVNGTALPVVDKAVNVPVPTATSELTNDSGFITGIDSSDVTDALGYTPYDASNPNGYITASQVPVTSVNGRTGAVTGLAEASAIPTKTSDLTNDSGFITSASVPTKTSELTNDSGFVTHDNQTEQSYISNPSSYTYWRGLAIGANAVASESGALSTTTDKVYVADAIRVQPSSGTIKATVFKGNLTGDVTGTASGNLTASDLVAITTAEIDALFV